MSFNNIDKKFFSLIYDYADIFEEIINKSLDYKINLTRDNFREGVGKVDVIDNNNNKKQHEFIIFGKYDKKTNEFEWIPKVKNFIASALLKTYKNFDLKLDTINKLLEKDKFSLPYQYKNGIPYMIGLMRIQKFNIIRFIAGDTEIYIILNLDIPNKLTHPEIIKHLSKYNEQFTNNKKQSRTKKNSKKISKKIIIKKK
jgi:hypothetical protein